MGVCRMPNYKKRGVYMPNLQQTGCEPEYFVTTLARIEAVAGNAVRLYLASQREGGQRLEYTAIIPASAMVVMAHMLLAAAANWKEPTILSYEATAH